MKLTANKKNLIDAMQIAASVIRIPPVSPITQMAKITANDKKVKVEATSAEENIVTAIDGVDIKQASDGETVLVDPKLIIDACKKSDGDEVVIEKDDNCPLAKMTIGKAKYNLNSPRTEDFPKFLKISDENEFSMNMSDLAFIAKNIGYAASRKGARPVLCGVFFSSDGNKLTCVATDSFRLSKKDFDIKSPAFAVVVPQKSLETACSVFKDEGKVRFRVTEKGIAILTDKTTYRSTLIMGKYPEVNRLFPTDYSLIVTANKQEMIKSIDRAMLICGADVTPVIKLDIKDGAADLYCSNGEKGDYTEELDVITKGDGIKIALHPNYLRDILKSCQSEFVQMKIVSDNKPIVVEPDDENDTHTGLVLPLRVYD